MKKLIYLCLMGLIPSGWVLAQGSVFFDPVQSKAESCQHLEKIQEILSCEQKGDTDCVSPGVNYAIPPFSGILFQGAATFMCSFQCVVGQERCDETLNPDGDESFGFGKS